MHPVAALERLGGVAQRDVLLRATTRRRLRTAVLRGEVLRTGNGSYALPNADRALVEAVRLHGAASHLSAAAAHRWELAHQPTRPQVVVPRNRDVPTLRRQGVDLRWRAVSAEDLAGHVTSPHQTVIDCAKDLPLVDALSVADSALRHRAVDADRLLDLAAALPTTGRRQALHVIGNASPLAANPFESALRALSLDVPGIRLVPQVVIDERGFVGRPDLVDRERRLVVEAESFAFHSSKSAFARDCERYTALTIRGWTVLRFTWRNVFRDGDYVKDVLRWWAEGPRAGAALPPALRWIA